MIMNSKKNEDQAAELKNLLDNHIENQKEINKEDENVKTDIDILDLPPRREIHTDSKRAHIKINKPLLRFLFVLLLLTIIILGAYYYVGDEIYSYMF